MLGGVAAALLGWILTGFLANFVLGLQGMSERESGRATVAFFAVAPDPGAQAEFGPWQRVDYIDDQPQQAARKGGEGDDYEIRYRVERAA